MQRCLKSAIPFSAALIVLLSLHTVSEAYVPQGAHILDLMIEGFGKANDTPAHLKEYADEGAYPVNKLPTRINKNAAEACKRLSFSLT